MLDAKVLKLAQWAKDSSSEHVTNGFNPNSDSSFTVAWAHEVLKKRFSVKSIHQACERLAEQGLLERLPPWGCSHRKQAIEFRRYKLAPEQQSKLQMSDD